MCKLLPLFMSLVALQWTATEPTLVPAGNHTQDDALYKSAHAPHPKFDESDMPRILGPRNSAGSNDDHVHLNNEERGIQFSMPSTLANIKSILSRLRKIFASGHGIHPVGAQMDLEALPEDLKTPMSYLQQLVERHPTHISKAGEDDPNYSIGELKGHIETLVRYRDVDDAHSMLKALAVRKDHAGQLMRGACVEADVSLEEFFRLLPISDDLIKVGFGDPAKYQKIYDDLKQWLRHVKVIVAKQRGAAYEMAKAKGRPFVYESFDPMSFFVNILMKEGKSENVWAFLEELRRIKAKPTFVQETTLQLLSNHPDVAEKMLQAWADGGLNPVDAAKRMPWEQVSIFDYRAAMAPLQEFANCKRLEQVLKYVALYRVHHTFAIGDVDRTLTKVPRANLRAYLMFLQGHQDVDAGSKELVKSLLALHEPTDSELGLTSQILSKLRAQDTPWSTAMADRPQALPNA